MEYVKISTVKLNPANPRIIRDEKYRKLVQSVAQFPKMLDVRGVVVDGSKMILGGNQRWRAILDLLKMPEGDLRNACGENEKAYAIWEVLREKKSVPGKWILDGSAMTDDEIRRFIIADNVEFGEHDWDALANGWDVEELADWGVEIPNFEPQKQEAKEDDYEMQDEIETDIQPGDLFEIGHHRLLCGDSTNNEDIKRLMGGEKADVVFTDPDFSMPFDALDKVYLLSKDHSNGFGLWVCADRQAVSLASKDFENFSGLFVQDFRQATLVSNTQPMTRHVMICKFGKRKMNNLFDGFSTIEHYSDANDLILDLFGHSGSTMIAAHQLNRRCFMMEIEPKYCQCIVDRMEKAFPGIEIKKNGADYLHNQLETNTLVAVD